MNCKVFFFNTQCWVQKNVDLQTYFFTALPFFAKTQSCI